MAGIYASKKPARKSLAMEEKKELASYRINIRLLNQLRKTADVLGLKHNKLLEMLIEKHLPEIAAEIAVQRAKELEETAKELEQLKKNNRVKRVVRAKNTVIDIGDITAIMHA
jgi:uncharacterized membrane protein YgaE (UPF0421/DUF939 family)